MGYDKFMINLRSEVHQKLLGYYFSHPNAEHYVRELSRILSFDVANLSRELRLLTKEGIFLSRDGGQEKFFRLNRNYPLFKELKRVTLRALGRNKNDH